MSRATADVSVSIRNALAIPLTDLSPIAVRADSLGESDDEGNAAYTARE
jgi:hypothetical protein